MTEQELFEFTNEVVIPIVEEEEVQEPTIETTEEEVQEEPTVVEEEQPDVEEEEESGTQDVSTEALKIYYNQLTESGVFEPFEKEEDITPENIQNAIKQMPEKMLTSAIQQMNPLTRELLSYAYNLGEDVSTDKLSNFFSKYVESQESYNMEEESDQEKFLRKFYTDKKTFIDSEDLDDQIEDLKSKGKLKQYAERFYAEQEGAREKSKKEQIEKAKQERAAKIEAQNKFNQNIKNQFQQLKWSDQLKRQTIPFTNADTIRNTSREIANSPKGYLQLAMIMSFWDNEKKEFNFDEFGKSYVSSVNNKIKEKIEQESFANAINGLKPSGISSKGGKTISLVPADNSVFDE